MKCDICGCTESIVKNHKHIYTIKGRNIEFVTKRRFCKSCNNLIYDYELDNIASQYAISMYNELYGVSKEEIINIRKKLGLSQDLFSKVIGCAKKTLISYEKGKSIPNDSYLILLKSIISSPESIKIIINANKDQFSEKEYDRLISRINLSSDIKLDEYNGYQVFSKEKIQNMILFFADKTVLKTKLLKEMFYSDFLYYKETCQSITGLNYIKFPHGPVPEQYDSILAECYNKKLIDYVVEYKNQYECHNISSKKKFDKTIFSKDELEILNSVKDKFKNYNSRDIEEYSHKEKAYIESKDGEKISYDYAYDININ